eukprot:CAMPEP_0118661948 /NCGR_PEP_ID=MMETSP0785-20121206/16559_1 /TAXON_ID=91992 /ORGANISM="Bolidomonas pacifica, Strain CCMP 1866" /LENGTH=279 /DNA_ID=CAMNT_0006555437 /DNA_START=65 /DNA_END=904 /DNA_ORIENTATION=-
MFNAIALPLAVLLLLLLLVLPASSFVVTTSRNAAHSSTTLNAEADRSRRNFLLTSSLLPLTPFLPVSPANAFGKLSSINSQLSAYGLPPLSPPKGFSPLLQPYGLGSNRSPVLVAFCHPGDWVVTLPSNDVNGEDGTVQAGNYAKGDTATFYVAEGEKGDVGDKEVAERVLRKAISQKGENVYQNFKLLKVEDVKRDGVNYSTVDFKYELLTGAGFEVDRRGVASLVSINGNAGVLWTATLSARYKKKGEDLREIAESFRAYSDGIQFDRIKYDEFGKV